MQRKGPRGAPRGALSVSTLSTNTGQSPVPGIIVSRRHLATAPGALREARILRPSHSAWAPRARIGEDYAWREQVKAFLPEIWAAVDLPVSGAGRTAIASRQSAVVAEAKFKASPGAVGEGEPPCSSVGAPACRRARAARPAHF